MEGDQEPSVNHSVGSHGLGWHFSQWLLGILSKPMKTTKNVILIHRATPSGKCLICNSFIFTF